MPNYMARLVTKGLVFVNLSWRGTIFKISVLKGLKLKKNIPNCVVDCGKCSRAVKVEQLQIGLEAKVHNNRRF
jgi:hypothetical protein